MATNFSVKHQGKDIHHPPSTTYKWPLSDLPRSTPCPSLSLSFTILQTSITNSVGIFSKHRESSRRFVCSSNLLLPIAHNNTWLNTMITPLPPQTYLLNPAGRAPASDPPQQHRHWIHWIPGIRASNINKNFNKMWNLLSIINHWGCRVSLRWRRVGLQAAASSLVVDSAGNQILFHSSCNIK